jgi:chlorite dismutase
MGEPLIASSGWTVSHWFYRIDRARWQALSAEARARAVQEASAWLAAAGSEEGLQLVPFALVGKGDLGVMAVHPDLRRHQQLGQELLASGLGACLTPFDSFLSISEASEYMSTEADWARMLIEDQHVDPASPDFASKLETMRTRLGAYADARLHPRLPADYPVLCFYPMAKARGEHHNWYTLSFAERKKYMQGHADAGRRHAGKVTQLITTCTGIDDWEWGVTLFSRDLKAIRDVVYEMRFDPGSAVYGVFGTFYIGIRFAADELGAVLCL